MGHAEIAQYLRTGVKNLSSLTMTGFHLIPPPGQDLLVEHDIVPDMPDGSSGLAHAKLRAAGIPLVGAIDLVHAREENYGVSDITETRDPYGTLKVVDWKFVGKLDYAKAPHELVETLQMAGYAKWAFETWPQIERVRLNHGYFPQKGSPRLVTSLVDRGQVEKTWNRAEVIAGSIRDAARETNPDKVDANTRACRAYGRPCPAIAVCKAAAHDSLAEYVGVTAAERLLSTFTPTVQPAISFDMTTPISPGSLVAHLQAQRAAQAQQQPQAPTFAFGVGQPTPSPVQTPFQTAPAQPVFASPQAPAPMPAPQPSPEVQAEMARLAAQEAAATQSPLAALKAAYEEAERAGAPYGVGFPMFSGQAAAMIAQARGLDYNGQGLAGSGELAPHTISDPAQLPQVFAEIKNIAARKHQELGALAAQAQEQVAAQIAQAQTQQTAPASAPPALLPPDAPPSNPALASKPPDAPAEAPKRRGRPPKKNKDAEAAAPTAAPTPTPAPPAEVALQPMPSAETVAAPAADPARAAHLEVEQRRPEYGTSAYDGGAPVAPTPSPVPANDVVHFYADCAPDGVQTQSFWPLINHCLNMMAQEEGLADVRQSASDRYGFGRWKGALAAFIRHAFKTGTIPPGHYVLDHSYTDAGSVAVEVMRDLLFQSGGRFVKGTR